MDDVDRAIIALLRDNARTSYREIGVSVGLSANAAADRVRRLVREGVITGFTATVDTGAAGRGLNALIDVRLGVAQDAERFETAIGHLDVVTDAVHVTGRFDYQLRVACRDASELDRTLRTLKRDAGVADTETRVVLRNALRRPIA